MDPRTNLKLDEENSSYLFSDSVELFSVQKTINVDMGGTTTFVNIYVLPIDMYCSIST